MSLSIEVVGSCGGNGAQDELASGRSNDLDRSRSRTFYEMSSVLEIMGLAKSRAREAPSRKPR